MAFATSYTIDTSPATSGALYPKQVLAMTYAGAPVVHAGNTLFDNVPFDTVATRSVDVDSLDLTPGASMGQFGLHPGTYMISVKSTINSTGPALGLIEGLIFNTSTGTNVAKVQQGNEPDPTGEVSASATIDVPPGAVYVLQARMLHTTGGAATIFEGSPNFQGLTVTRMC